MKRIILTITLLWIAAACKPKPREIPPQKKPKLELNLPQNLINKEAFLPLNPKITLPDGSNTPLYNLIQKPQNILIWASWCPPKTIPNTPLLMLSIDQCTHAWRIAIDQLPKNPNATHARIDPYAETKFLQKLGYKGVPQVINIKPEQCPTPYRP